MSTHADKASVDELERYLHVLAGREPAGALLELRFRRAPGRSMRQRFYPAARARRAAETALWLSRTSDVYVGVLPRHRRAGGKAALERAWVLWADCDTPEAAAELERFAPAPAIVVASGGDGARHAYWPLERPVDALEAEQRNRAIARALGADERSCDAARILRPLSVAELVRGCFLPAPSFADASVAGARRGRGGRVSPSGQAARRASGAPRPRGAR